MGSTHQLQSPFLGDRVTLQVRHQVSISSPRRDKPGSTLVDPVAKKRKHIRVFRSSPNYSFPSDALLNRSSLGEGPWGGMS